ncbi:hypothetical protein CL620_05395 [archaeon]|nr:hypothetical protein [archaeon]
MQREVIRLVLHDQKEEALQYVREMIIRLKERRIPRDKLILRTQITRDLSAYTSAGPHVKVARLLANKGINISPGTVIEYIIAKGQGSIGERAQIPREAKEYDVDYYLNNQLIPAVSSIFEVFAISEDELLGEGKQTGLGGYF